MNSQEAINALFEGKYVRQPHWEEDQYIYLYQGAFPKYAIDWSCDSAAELLFKYNDWEIYEEMYQWLCQEVASGDFFLSDYVAGNFNYGVGAKFKAIKRLDETRKII